ncbi:hypothetical protein AC478_02535 [miscellaneous Crenarchaeota group-1 archaeon SG8-32-3]|uniref:DUF485 domain-containing protein n=1 Tax=miscellaneous Crenarchaeota group-1 archaeon SG8-32-3 TaxID=1685125 RepID=A0A0M0BT67_9ARCH|nr:MAG: hypothetical protein AC478_02535 [miscellaneous Crenarchaeota group-1 archaeon SG8-32-3]
MKSKQAEVLVFLAQGIGVVFYVIFLAAFYIPLPSNDTLIGDLAFRTPLSILGGIFLILILISLAAAYFRKQE